jgi:DNA processing protein
VEYALELGKEVFAVPGPIGSPTSAGTNQLLKEGARLVTSARDVLEELHGVGVPVRPVTGPAAAEPAVPAPRTPPADLAADEARVFAQLADEPRHVDDLATRAGVTTSAALGALLGLELRELVEALPGKQFRLR